MSLLGDIESHRPLKAVYERATCAPMLLLTKPQCFSGIPRPPGQHRGSLLLPWSDCKSPVPSEDIYSPGIAVPTLYTKVHLLLCLEDILWNELAYALPLQCALLSKSWKSLRQLITSIKLNYKLCFYSSVWGDQIIGICNGKFMKFECY